MKIRMRKLLSMLLLVAVTAGGTAPAVYGAEAAGETAGISAAEASVTNPVDSVDYMYIESPYLETPGTQRIVFSMEGSLDGTETMTITVADEDGNFEDWLLSAQENSTYLFEKTFEDSGATGTYRILSLNIEQEGAAYSVSMDEMGIDARFGVNEEYDGFEELQPVSSLEEDPAVEATVVTLDGEEDDSIEADITEALAAAGEESGVPVTTLAASSGGSTAGSSGKAIVALDPGHDKNDAGASANGLKEEDLTLKIAQYCKQELETYGGISVYMTRTTAECPYNCTSAGECIAQRAAAAAAAGANVYVSLHLNASTSTAANGAEILIPNENWKPEVGQKGEKLAEEILEELTDLGLSNRGIYSKDTTIDEEYPDGSLSDYFSVMIYNKENNIPGIIVEHAFLTNTGDVDEFLKTESGLKKLGVADATGIAKYFGVAKGSWVWDSSVSGWRWKDSSGNYKENYWVYQSGYWYYLNTSGIMVKGWNTIDGSKFYMNDSGAVQLGWLWDDAWYYLDEYVGAWTGWLWSVDAWYFMNDDGVMQTGWLEDDGKTYYLKSNGKMATGEQVIDGTTYNFSSSGELLGEKPEETTGWVQESGKWYYLDGNGKVKGWLEIDGKRYFLDPETGERETGWIWDGSAWYYLDDEGVMQTGWIWDGSAWYYLNQSGVMQTGWIWDDAWYYLNQSGAMQTGWIWDDAWYYLNQSGVMQTGWIWDDAWYYLNNSGAMQTGWIWDDAWYYLNQSGVMQTGWLTEGNNKYYLKSNGVMTTGWYYIDSGWYYFNDSGVWIEDKELPEELYTVEGETNITVNQMADRYRASGATYPSEDLKEGGAETIEDFCSIIIEEAEKENIKAEIVFAQAMVETGWLAYGGDVKISQYNFAGLGATGNGVAGNSYKDVRTGIRAQVQHLKAYCSYKDLNQECVDDRFQYVKRYSSPFVEWLGQKENPAGLGWATGQGYGSKILSVISGIK